MLYNPINLFNFLFWGGLVLLVCDMMKFAAC